MAPEGIKWHPSPNFDDREATTPIDMLVLHYTGMPTAADALDRLTDEKAKVSVHYLVNEDGRILALVPEEKRAWHAGVSHWRGADNINARSIGIEIVNPGHEFGYRHFPDVQMAAVVELAADIVRRRNIRPFNVVGHSDVAPDRKEDPGELFDWKRLAEGGAGFWFSKELDMPEGLKLLAPGAEGNDVTAIRRALLEIGYNVAADGAYDAKLETVVRAFQRHWRQAQVDGIADPETQATICALQTEVRSLT
ncbi:MAG: N-acetylmuramoyl-L-alanine amidase [Sneathiella sp.]|nr:N-acetylmuramoyl-L-alanine amidase [Sneathiella sp.]